MGTRLYVHIPTSMKHHFTTNETLIEFSPSICIVLIHNMLNALHENPFLFYPFAAQMLIQSVPQDNFITNINIVFVQSSEQYWSIYHPFSRHEPFGRKSEKETRGQQLKSFVCNHNIAQGVVWVVVGPQINPSSITIAHLILNLFSNTTNIFSQFISTIVWYCFLFNVVNIPTVR